MANRLMRHFGGREGERTNERTNLIPLLPSSEEHTNSSRNSSKASLPPPLHFSAASRLLKRGGKRSLDRSLANFRDLSSFLSSSAFLRSHPQENFLKGRPPFPLPPPLFSLIGLFTRRRRRRRRRNSSFPFPPFSFENRALQSFLLPSFFPHRSASSRNSKFGRGRSVGGSLFSPFFPSFPSANEKGRGRKGRETFFATNGRCFCGGRERGEEDNKRPWVRTVRG